MSDEEQKQKQRDEVTLGQVRRRTEAALERQIQELANIIRKGHMYISQAEKFLKEDILATQNKLYELSSMASVELMFPEVKDG